MNNHLELLRWCLNKLLLLLMMLLIISCDKSDDEQYPKFYFHLVADVEFDGEHLVYDEYVFCEGYGTGSFGAPPNRAYRMSSITMGKRLNGGGVLFLKTPHACGAGNTIWNENQNEDRTAKENMQEEFDKIELPDNIIPFFYWMDDDVKPNNMEAYISETYFEQSYARLKINKVFIGDYTLTLPEGVVVDDYEVNLPDPMSPSFIFGEASPETKNLYSPLYVSWISRSLFPIFEEEWKTSPIFVDAIGHLTPEDDIFIFPRALYAEGEKNIVRENLSNPIHKRSSYSGARSLNSIKLSGLPRHGNYSEKYEKLSGYMLGLATRGSGTVTEMEDAWQRIDEILPLKCTNKECELVENRVGVSFFTHSDDLILIENLKFKGKNIPITDQERTVFYDPETRTIWGFDNITTF